MKFIRRIKAETLRLKFRDKIYVRITRRKRRSELVAEDFTIISNNCWGGTVYESFGLQKMTPTAGMFIMPADYITMLRDLPAHLAMPLSFITPDESKWTSELGGSRDWGKYLIGRIGEVELHMLHYHDEASARRKWEDRATRVNFDKIMYKFNDQNGCQPSHVRDFDDLELEHKVFFCVDDHPGIDSAVKVRSPRAHDSIRASYEPLVRAGGFRVVDYLNGLSAPVRRR